MSIILSLVRDGISNDLLAPVGYRQVARISGKDVVRIFGTRTGEPYPAGLRAAFLLDGFDEVPPAFRMKVESEILRLAGESPSAGIVLAGREVPSGPSWNHWSIHQIPELTEEQIAAYLVGTPKADLLRRILVESPQLAGLARQPAYLHTIRNAWVRGTDVRGYLMREIPRYVVWRGHTKSRLPTSVSPQLVDRVLSLLALNLAMQGTHASSYEGLETIATTVGEEKAAATLVDAARATDALVCEGTEVSFRHLALLHAYAARALVSDVDAPPVLELHLSLILAGPFKDGIVDHFLNLLSDDQFAGLRSKLSPAVLAALLEATPCPRVESARARVSAAQGFSHELGGVAAAVARYAARRDAHRKDILVIAVPGFNTRGDWRNRLGLVLTRATDGERFLYRAWDYGEFRLGILNPLARSTQVRAFQTFFNDLVGSFQDRPEIAIVAHSFGAYIVAHAARRFPEVRFNRVLLVGAALPRRFDWSRSLDRCGCVLNLTGGADLALAIARFVPGLGAAGRAGFLSRDRRLVQRSERFSDHSDLFGSEYMRHVWLPYLRDGSLSAWRPDEKAA